MTLLLLTGSRLAFEWGVLFSARVVERQGYLDLLSPPDQNASIRIPTWAIITALSGIETLMQLGFLVKLISRMQVPNRLGVTSANRWDWQNSQECCCFLGEYS